MSSSSWFSSGRETDLSWWLGDEADGSSESFGRSEENERDFIIYVLDCHWKMFSESESCVFEDVCKCVVNSLKRKIIQSKDDCVAVVLFNTKGERNALGHEHLYVVSEADAASAQLMRTVRSLPQAVTGEGVGDAKLHRMEAGETRESECDLRQLLWVLQNLFSEAAASGRKFGSKRAFVFTANDEPRFESRSATVAKARDMSDAGIELMVVPLAAGSSAVKREEVEVKRPKAEGLCSHQFVVSKIYGDLCTFDSDDLVSEKELLRQCTTLSELERDLRSKEVKKRALISCPLTIGGDSHVAVKLFCVRRRAAKETAQWLDARTNEALTANTRWLCADSGQYLDDFSIRNYHEFGPCKQKVFFSKEESTQLKAFGSPSLVLLGFKPLRRLKPYMSVSPSYFMRPDDSRIEGSTVCFSALLSAMSRLHKFAVARLIARKSSGPRLVALLPQKEKYDAYGSQQTAPGFHVLFLPYADDIRKLKLWQLRRATEAPQLIAKAKAVVDKLSVASVPLPSNPVLQRHYDALESLALEEEIEEEAVDEIVPDVAGMQKRAGDLMQALVSAVSEASGGGHYSLPKSAASGKRKKAVGEAAAGKRSKARKTRAAADASESSGLDWLSLAQSDQLSSLKVTDLKLYLAENGLRKSGKKADLVARIKEHLGVS